jgi:hypothetical protein
VSLPPEGILEAAASWLSLLPRSSVAQANALLHSGSRYLEFSTTQYAGALAWLIDIGVIVTGGQGLQLRPTLEGSTRAELHAAAFRAGLQASGLAWLRDADLHVHDVSELPADAARLSAALKVDRDDALLAVRQVHGKIDHEARARIGFAGEQGVLSALNDAWGNAARHVALESDGLGYDISMAVGGVTWHLEIKSTTRRGRLVVYLSRQEFEVGRRDPGWHLVVAGLGPDNHLAALATVSRAVIFERAPSDYDGSSRWESTRHEFGPSDLHRGLGFLPSVPPSTDSESRELLEWGSTTAGLFEWMPPRDRPVAV